MFSKNNYVVNVSNIEHNIKVVRRVVGNKVKICAIVKADAYGMGMQAVVDALKYEADFFGVASVCEASNLRQFNKICRVLILGEVNLDAINWCADNNVSVTVSNLQELEFINQNLHDKLLKIHLKVNSGLNRLGFDNLHTFRKALSVIKKSNVMVLEGLFTHFATKQNDVEFIEKQYNFFENFTKLVGDDVIVHCSNSYATLNVKSHHCDMVRTGFALYGEHVCDYKLKRTLSITSEIVFVHRVRKGQTIGYDRTLTATKDMLVAVVPVGYADGLDRRLSNNFYLLVNGCRANIVGNICMDVALIDVTNISQVHVGSKVTLLGVDGGEELSVNDYAKALNTSPYEILLKFNHKRMNYVVVNE